LIRARSSTPSAPADRPPSRPQPGSRSNGAAPPAEAGMTPNRHGFRSGRRPAICRSHTRSAPTATNRQSAGCRYGAPSSWGGRVAWLRTCEVAPPSSPCLASRVGPVTTAPRSRAKAFGSPVLATGSP
jgi:hypothetical protein